MSNVVKKVGEAERHFYARGKRGRVVRGKIDTPAGTWYHYCRGRSFVMLRLEHDCELCGATPSSVKEVDDGEVST